jgi:hypothetical protein
VSGKGDKPILDITGAKIAEHFSGDRVAVRYSAGKITIGNPAD